MPTYGYEPVNMQPLAPGQTLRLRAPGARTPYEEAQAKKSADTRRMFLNRIVLPTAALATGGAALSAVGGASGAALPSAMGSSAIAGGGSAVPAILPAASKGFSLGSLLKHPLTGLAVQGVTSLLGQRSTNKANQAGIESQERGLLAQMELERERLAQERAEIAAQREEDRRRWEADEAFKARQFASDEEDRAYTREQLRARDARRAQFYPMADRARMTLGSMLGIG